MYPEGISNLRQPSLQVRFNVLPRLVEVHGHNANWLTEQVNSRIDRLFYSGIQQDAFDALPTRLQAFVLQVRIQLVEMAGANLCTIFARHCFDVELAIKNCLPD